MNISRIKGFKITNINWLVEEEDVLDLIEDGMTDEEIESLIDQVEQDLPTEAFLPYESDNPEALLSAARELDEWLSDTYGYLVKSFNYAMIGDDGEEHYFNVTH